MSNIVHKDVIDNSIKAHLLRKDTYFTVRIADRCFIKYVHPKEFLSVSYRKMVNGKIICLKIGTYYSEELETDPQLSINYTKYSAFVDYDEIVSIRNSLDALSKDELLSLRSFVSQQGYGKCYVTQKIINKCKNGEVLEDIIAPPECVEKPVNNVVETKENILSDIELLELKIKREELKKRLKELESENA